ncbi:hypothetical protein V8B97DRAFT_1938719 [Scleroderma yunnanense]
MYIMLRYFATLFIIIDAAGVYNGAYKDIKTCTLLHIWLACVIFWLVQVILQLRLYALYHGSTRVVLVMVIGFVTEIIYMLFAMIELTILYVHDTSPPSSVYSVPDTPTVVYLSCGVLAGYECLLLSLAIAAGIKHSQGNPALAFWSGKRLTDIIIKGNVQYFFANLLSVLLYIMALKPTLSHFQGIVIIENFIVALIAAPGCRLIMHARCATASSHDSACVDHSQWRVASAGNSNIESPT